MLKAIEFFGSTGIGEKGQVVVPAELRKKYGIKPGDKFLVLAGKRNGAWGIILVKSDLLSKAVNEMFGDDSSTALEQWQTASKTRSKGN